MVKICNGIVLQNQQNEILLVCDKRGMWSFPKGKQEPRDENSYQGARREFIEETGLTNFSYSYIPKPYIEPSKTDRPGTNLFFARIIKEYSSYGFIPNHKDIDNDIVEAKWMSISEINRIPGVKFSYMRKQICEAALHNYNNLYTDIDDITDDNFNPCRECIDSPY